MDGRGGAAILIGGVFVLLAVNQVVIKLTNQGGFQPVFGAALRSLGGGVAVLSLWMLIRRVPLEFRAGTIGGAGVLAGLVFSAEFVCLYVALDLTTVTRVSVIFYSMPVWMAVVAHFTCRGGSG